MLVSSSRRVQRIVDFITAEVAELGPELRLETVQLFLLQFSPEMKELARRGEQSRLATQAPRIGSQPQLVDNGQSQPTS